MPFKVNLYDPYSQGYAPRISHNEWEKHRNVISQLHTTRTPRKVIIKQLRDDYGFRVTIGQLQAKCKEWDLKVYSKEDGPKSRKAPARRVPAASVAVTSHQPQICPQVAAPAFHIATASGFAEEWAVDYRVHPQPLSVSPSGPLTNGQPLHNHNADLHDRSLPPEYIGGGLFANTADSHWPVPEDETQSEAMLQAAHYYYSIHAFRQAFSIYRAVYLYQRRHLSLSDPHLVTTILQSSCAAVTDHQRNIMHSVLLEMGASPDIDHLDPLLVDCLQSAALNMVSSDATCDVDDVEQVRARSVAYHYALNALDAVATSPILQSDLQGLLYNFEHSLLMQEHETKILQKLLDWCDTAIEHLQRDLDDIFVGRASSSEEYYHRIAQVLSGHLLSHWLRQSDEQPDIQPELLSSSNTDPCSFRFQVTTTQTLVALAFMVVDAVKSDPFALQAGTTDSSLSMLWFLDAAKLFKRGIRMLRRLDERSRCSVFSSTFLERFYTSISFRQKAYHWTAQLPAIGDFVGMSLAQQRIAADTDLNIGTSPNVLPEEDIVLPLETSTPLKQPDIPDFEGISINRDPTFLTYPTPAETAPSPMSDCNSIASFLDTYHRTLKSRLGSSIRSGRSTPGDVMSFASSAEFKFGIAANVSVSADVDSLWQMISSCESLIITT
ncbi:hypothetical protein H2198_005346 [Neophaeococcomyces mojaviensis]|uniref:Uncharacterized protein n=1 Tax=Neophaeococcomyces mojaviensis TaxID=3383035 RepID=A0ACC3A5Y4_9EURO|nr:hypothetical protein H2198_005346 [Knufia sp. JES_112]